MSFKNRRLSLLCRFQSFCTSFPISPVTKSYNWILLHVNISGYLVLHIIFLRQNFLCVGGTTQYSWQSFSCIGRNTTRLYLSPSASLFFRTSSVLEWPEICQKMLKVQFHQILPKLTLSADNFWSLISLSCIQGIVDFDNLAWPYHYHYHGRQEMQFQTLTSLPAWSAWPNLLSITFPACMISAPNLVSGPSSMCDGLTIGQNFIVSRFQSVQPYATFRPAPKHCIHSIKKFEFYIDI